MGKWVGLNHLWCVLVLICGWTTVAEAQTPPHATLDAMTAEIVAARPSCRFGNTLDPCSFQMDYAEGDVALCPASTTYTQCFVISAKTCELIGGQVYEASDGMNGQIKRAHCWIDDSDIERRTNKALAVQQAQRVLTSLVALSKDGYIFRKHDEAVQQAMVVQSVGSLSIHALNEFIVSRDPATRTLSCAPKNIDLLGRVALLNRDDERDSFGATQKDWCAAATHCAMSYALRPDHRGLELLMEKLEAKPELREYWKALFVAPDEGRLDTLSVAASSAACLPHHAPDDLVRFNAPITYRFVDGNVVEVLGKAQDVPMENAIARAIFLSNEFVANGGVSKGEIDIPTQLQRIDYMLTFSKEMRRAFLQRDQKRKVMSFGWTAGGAYAIVHLEHVLAEFDLSLMDLAQSEGVSLP